MKKILIVGLAFILIISMAGCGVKEKIEQKAGEAIAEKIIEGAGGGDVDIDGDKVVVKGEDGSTATFGGSEWPDSELGNSIPEFKDGTVVGAIEMNESLYLTLEQVSEKDFLDYFEEIKETFNQDVFDMRSEGNVTYGAANGEGLSITLIYGADETLSIALAKEVEE